MGTDLGEGLGAAVEDAALLQLWLFCLPPVLRFGSTRLNYLRELSF